MSLVKVKTKGQITLSTRLRQQVGLRVGDLLDVKVASGKITLVPQSVIDRDIAEGLEDFKKGRYFGPFSTAKQMTAFLHRRTKKGLKKTKHS
jgi:AbrB family looped-hinge helix DNA binding protein